MNCWAIKKNKMENFLKWFLGVISDFGANFRFDGFFLISIQEKIIHGKKFKKKILVKIILKIINKLFFIIALSLIIFSFFIIISFYGEFQIIVINIMCK